MLLTIETLGEVCLRWADGRTFVPAAAREIQVLEALLVSDEFCVPASALAVRLWPDSPQAETNLADLISKLCKRLGTDDDDKQPLYHSGGWIGIDPSCGPFVEAFRFEAAAREVFAMPAHAEAESASRTAAAAALAPTWNGEYLPESREPATVRRRAELATVRAALLAVAARVSLLDSAFEVTPHDAAVAALLVEHLVTRGEHRAAAIVRNRHARARHAREFARGPQVSSLPAFVTEVVPRVAIAEREAFVARAIAATGESSAFVVDDGWGAGKTRTLGDLALAAEAAGWRVGFYAAQQIDRDVPPATIHFRIAAALAKDGDVERYRATIEDIVSSDRPAMIVIDDAHHLSDAALASLLAIVAENIGRSAPAFAASTKTETLRALCGSSASFRTLNASGFALAVPRAADIESIVRARFGGRVVPRVLDIVTALWPGNLHAIASVAEHTIASGIVGRTERGFDFIDEAVPEANRLVTASFRFAVEAKLGALDAPARSILRAAAFAGVRVTPGELAGVTGIDAANAASALDALHAAGLLLEWNTRFAIVPTLVASIAAASVGHERAASVRQRFAELRDGRRR